MQKILAPYTYWIRNNPEKLVLFLIGIFLPFRIDALLYQSYMARSYFIPSFFSGSFVNFTEILLLLFLIFRLWKGPFRKISLWLWGLFFLCTIITSVLALDPVLSFMFLRFPLYALLLWMSIPKESEVHVLKIGLCISGVTEVFVALYQVVFQKAIGLHLLGEPHLSDTSLYFAKYVFGSLSFIRGYGTFDHPNILGGYLVLLLGILFFTKNVFSKKMFCIVASVFSFGVLISGSKAAILAIVILFLFKLKNKKIVWVSLIPLAILFLVTHVSSYSERIIGIFQSLSFIIFHPLGVGFGSYTSLLLTQTAPLAPWLIMPVHNSFLLVLIEGGIPVFVVSCVGIYYYFQRYLINFLAISLSIIFLGCFDHYLLTGYPVLMLVILTLCYIFPLEN